MNIKREIKISAQINDVWKVLAEDFDEISEWASLVPKSVVKSDTPPVENAPVAGRVCDFSSNPNGPKVSETITLFDDKNYVLKFEVVPIQGSLLPLKVLIPSVSLVSNDENETLLVWDVEATLKPHGFIVYPLLKLGMGNQYNNLLEELKYFVENKKPHPRKIAKTKN